MPPSRLLSGKTHQADEPDDVRNLVLTPGDMMIMAAWDVATDNGSPVTGYEVHDQVQRQGLGDCARLG